MAKIVCCDYYGNAVMNLTQWDTNRVLKFFNWEYATKPVVQFTNRSQTATYSVDSSLEDGTVSFEVPNAILQNTETVLVFIGVPRAGSLKEPFFATTLPATSEGSESKAYYIGTDANGYTQYDFSATDSEYTVVKEGITKTQAEIQHEYEANVEMETVFKIELPIQRRMKPAGYVYTDNADVIDIIALRTLLQKALEDGLDDINDALEDGLQEIKDNIKDGSPKGIITPDNITEFTEGSSHTAGIYLFSGFDSGSDYYRYNNYIIWYDPEGDPSVFTDPILLYSATLPWTELSEDVDIDDLEDGSYVATDEIVFTFGSGIYDVMGLNAGDIISIIGAQAVILSSYGFIILQQSSGVWYADAAAMQNEVDTALSGKQDTLTAGAGISITNNVISATAGITFEVVQTLPASGTAQTIYLVPNSGSTPNIYDEYIYVNNSWEKIGTTDIDLSGYIQTSAIKQTTGTGQSDLMSQDAITTALSGKQDALAAGQNILINNGTISADNNILHFVLALPQASYNVEDFYCIKADRLFPSASAYLTGNYQRIAVTKDFYDSQIDKTYRLIQFETSDNNTYDPSPKTYHYKIYKIVNNEWTLETEATDGNWASAMKWRTAVISGYYTNVYYSNCKFMYAGMYAGWDESLNITDVNGTPIDTSLINPYLWEAYKRNSTDTAWTFVGTADFTELFNYVETEVANKLNTSAVKQTTGSSTTDIMSQKAVSDALSGKLSNPLIFSNITVSSWDSNADTGYEAYSYKKSITCSGVTSSMLATLILPQELATSGNYACDTGADTVTIYAKVNTAITINSIIAGAPISIALGDDAINDALADIVGGI